MEQAARPDKVSIYRRHDREDAEVGGHVDYRDGDPRVRPLRSERGEIEASKSATGAARKGRTVSRPVPRAPGRPTRASAASPPIPARRTPRCGRQALQLAPRKPGPQAVAGLGIGGHVFLGSGQPRARPLAARGAPFAPSNPRLPRRRMSADPAHPLPRLTTSACCQGKWALPACLTLRPCGVPLRATGA